MLGALLQGLLCFLPYRNIALIAPVVMVLGFQVARTLLMSFGITENIYMDGVINGRTVPVFPSKEGAQDKPAAAGVCAIMLAVRSNDPLGIFELSGGFNGVSDRFTEMSKQLDANATTYGYLGQSSWLSAADRGVSSEFMSILYFESAEKLHEYAHGPMHTEAMVWWQKLLTKHSKISIMHEVFSAPAHAWEGVYINYHPTGLGAASKEVELEKGGKVWMNPLVQGRGQLNYSRGRMGLALKDNEWNAFEETLGPEEK